MDWKDRLRFWVATCFGLGMAPVAPGTAGALLGVLAFVGILLGAPASWHTPLLALSLVLVSWANHLLTPWAVKRWARKDPGNFVLDEVAGYLTTVLLFRGGPNLLNTLVLTFVMTRVLDILKVPPARQFERIPGAWGILLDDVVSGIYAALALHGARWLWPSLFGL